MSDLHYFSADWITKTDRTLTADLCIYGATSAGIVAAIEAVKRGKTIVLLNPGKHVGGLSSGGLGETDFGKQHVIGGLSREFYRRLGKFYGKAEEWHFAPSAAQAVYDGWMKEHGIKVEACQYLDRVEKSGTNIVSITMLGGLKVTAKMFLDCTYEGDLLAKAGVSYTVGREGNATYGEQINGIQVRKTHQFVPAEVSPYVIANDPASGLLPNIEADDLSKKQGQADTRVQAYNFRICMTDDPALKVPWAKPEKFDPKQYILAERWFSGAHDQYNEQLRDGWKAPAKFDILTNKTPGGFRKTDTNNHGPVSSDFIGANHEWPDGCYERREELFQAHVTYQQGLYWFLANSPAIPEKYRTAYATWGLAKDEHTTSGHWPPQLYIREARRMVAAYVLTEHDCMYTVKADDPVAMGSYNCDSHNCTRFINAEGKVMNEGDVQIAPKGPYGISYRAIVPKPSECTNLLVPVCCSTSHIAYGSVRMEPVFMALGQSAAAAACHAIDGRTSVQAIPYAKLRSELERDGQVLSL